MITKISDSLILPCGAEISNRIAKSAMSENMAEKNHHPGTAFCQAYRQWAKGGAGLCISGNVMVDSEYRGEPRNVVIEKEIDNLQDLCKWAQATEGSKNQIWLQLNHPGKQTPKFLTKVPVAPSAVSLKPPLDKMFNTPRELSEIEIWDIVERFSYAATIAKKSGFQGVQIHGAHGYLVSQFLSPKHNKRKDEWGGDIKKRVKFVSEIYLKMRKSVGKDFPIGIKMNSADFSRGGFTHEEAIFVAKHLSDLGMDLIELSGGSYEVPAMMGESKSTVEREAYFLDYAKDIKEVISCPLMLTGGFRSATFMREVIEKGEVDLIGLGRSLCIDPDFPQKILNGENCTSLVKPVTSGYRRLDRLLPLEIIWYTEQIRRMGQGKKPRPELKALKVILKNISEYGIQGLKRVRGKS